MSEDNFEIEFEEIKLKGEHRAFPVLEDKLNKASIPCLRKPSDAVIDVEIPQGRKPLIDIKAVTSGSINITDAQIYKMNESLKSGRPFYFAVWSPEYEKDIFLMKLVPFSTLVEDSTKIPSKKR